MIKSLYPFAQRWCQNGSIYIISDPHFGEMDMNWRVKYIDNVETLVPEERANIIINKITESVNSFCGRSDTLIVLGDVGVPQYIYGLKAGYKVLIKGNHDKGNSNYEGYFDEIYEGPLMISEKIMLSHESLNGPWFNFHGHEHDTLTDRFNSLNCAVENNKFQPINLGYWINQGILKDLDSIHRITIDNATDRKNNKIKWEDNSTCRYYENNSCKYNLKDFRKCNNIVCPIINPN